MSISIKNLDLETGIGKRCNPSLKMQFQPGTWFAMDEDGAWYMYDEMPRPASDEWQSTYGSMRRLNADFFLFPACADWRQSLFQA